MPKFMLNASGDQFFLPDSSQFYFDDLRGEKHLRYVPNTSPLARQDRRAREPAGVLLDDRRRARRGREFTWTFERDGAIKVVAKDRPEEVLAVAGDESDGAELPARRRSAPRTPAHR